MINIDKEFNTILEVIALEDLKAHFYNNKELVSKQFYNFYYSIAKYLKPTSILEIGNINGYSSYTLIAGAKAGRATTVVNYTGSNRPTNSWHVDSQVQQILKKLENIIYSFINTSQLKDLTVTNYTYDLVHIDATYDSINCLNYIINCLDHLSKKGSIIVTNTNHALVRAGIELLQQHCSDVIDIEHYSSYKGIALIKFNKIPNKSSLEKCFSNITYNKYYNSVFIAAKSIEVINQANSSATNTQIQLLMDILKQHITLLNDFLDKHFNCSISYKESFKPSQKSKILTLAFNNKTQSTNNITTIFNYFIEIKQNKIAAVICKNLLNEVKTHNEYIAAKMTSNRISQPVIADYIKNISLLITDDIFRLFWYKNWQPNSTLQLINTCDLENSPQPFPVKNDIEYTNYYVHFHVNCWDDVYEKIKSDPTRNNLDMHLSTYFHIDHFFRTCSMASYVRQFIALLKEKYPTEAIYWLDVGCGPGIIPYLANLDSSVQIIGIDLAKDDIKLANNLKHQDNYQFIEGDVNVASKLLNRNKFHLITCFEILEHLQDPVAVIRSLIPFMSDYILSGSPLNEHVPNEPQLEHLWSFTEGAYQQLFVAAGLKVVYSSTISVGKFHGGGHNWTIAGASCSGSFRF